MISSKNKIVFKTFFLAISLVFSVALFATVLKVFQQKRQELEPGLITEYGFKNLKKAYPGWKENELYELLKETSDWPMIYEPFTCIKHAEKKGQFVNWQNNYRFSCEKQVWPPEKNKKTIWIFGGSTVLGAGVPDWNTIPALIQKKIRNQDYQVFNFGRGFYFSTQEKILFLQLLTTIPKPALVIFLHGLNDFYYSDGTPEFTDQIDSLFAQKQKKQIITKKSINTKEISAVYDVLKRLKVNRQQIKAICDSEKIIYLEVIQPVPLYEYPQNLFIFSNSTEKNYGRHYLHKLGYEVLNNQKEYKETTKSLLNISALLKKSKSIAYCDSVHYTEDTNKLIAEAVVKHLQKYYIEF